jgi:beta-galactosidase
MALLAVAMGGWAQAQPAAPAPAPALQLDKFVMKAPAGPADRVETPLAGVWEVGRWLEPEIGQAKPDAEGQPPKPVPIPNRTDPIQVRPEVGQVTLMPAKVPGAVPPGTGAASNAHRIISRTTVTVPATLEGRSFYLHLPSCNMITSVFVNGQFIGGSKTPFAIWDCDVTKGIKPGQDNEILLAIKDVWYALGSAETTAWQFTVPQNLYDTHSQGIGMASDFPVFTRSESGILEAPVLVAAGQVYTSDVYAIPSVQKKQLGLEVTVFNPTGADVQATVDNEVVPLAGGAVEKKFPVQNVTIPAGKEAVVKLSEAWDNAKLWWPDEPNQYNVVTRVAVAGKPVDVKMTKFGFREWQWDSLEFKLNGVPWHMWADTYPGTGDPAKSMEIMKAHGQRMWRFWGSTWCGLDQQGTLDYMDQGGMPVRRSGVFDGEMASYNWWDKNPELMNNWRTQLQAMVKGERNHPSIFIWSMENEVTFINSRNLGKLATSDPEIKKAAQMVMALDPTRPVMVDGGNALLDNSLPVNGCHYLDAPWNTLPDASYTLDFLKGSKGKDNSPWDVNTDRPILLGEAFFARGNNPSEFAQVMGEQAFLGRAEAAMGVSLVARMYSEGYRFAKVNPHYWLYEGELPYYTSWQPVAALVREWNATFASGQAVKRTVTVFNDTHDASPIGFAWQVKQGDKVVKEGKKSFTVAPGGASEATEIAFDVPAVKERTAAQLVLTCARGGKEVFKDVKELAFLNPEVAAKPKLQPADLVVLDPQGAVKDRLKKRGVAFTEAAAYEQLPEKASVVIVGKDALAGKADDGKLHNLAQGGARVLVLEQSQPLVGNSVPGAALSPPDKNPRRGGNQPQGPAPLSFGRISFAQALAHPLFAGLQQSDLSFWAGDHVVYRGAYAVAPTGSTSLVQCDKELGYAAVVSDPVGPGLLMLCQMVVGEKLPTEPAAQILFDNMVNVCTDYKLEQKATAVALDPASKEAELLAASGVKYDKAADPLQAIASGKYQIVVAAATPETMAKLAGAAADVKKFATQGGWLMLWGLDDKGLADFNKLVGVNHLIRPFETEKVSLLPKRDLLLTGLTMRDVAMSGARMNNYSGDTFAAGDVFTNVVDLDDIAPFCQFPDPADLKLGADSKPGGDHWPRNIVNGFTTADSWKYCLSLNYGEGCPTKITLTLPREEEIAQFDAVFNALYGKVTKFQLVFNDDPATALKFDAQPNNDPQTFKVEPARKAKKITIDITDWEKNPKSAVVGIDNVWIRVKRSDDFNKKVVPLLNIGALVKYPMDKGGVVLNELHITGDAKQGNEAKKKNIVATILHNMGATFEAGAAPAPAPADQPQQ